MSYIFENFRVNNYRGYRNNRGISIAPINILTGKNNEQKIIALPKAGALNKAIYAGSDYKNLKITTGETAKIMLDSLMKSAIKNHPKFICCDSRIQKLLQG